MCKARVFYMEGCYIIAVYIKMNKNNNSYLSYQDFKQGWFVSGVRVTLVGFITDVRVTLVGFMEVVLSTEPQNLDLTKIKTSKFSTRNKKRCRHHEVFRCIY